MRVKPAGWRSGPSVPGTSTIELGGRSVSYHIRRSPRAKHVRLEIRSGTGLSVIVPGSYDVGKLPDLIRRKQGWVLDKLARLEAEPAPSAGMAPRSGLKLPYLGRSLKVVECRGPGSDATVKLERGRLVVDLGTSAVGLSVAVEAWYRWQAGGLMRRRAAELGAEMGLAYNRLTVRGQKTRWGSCSQKGNLSFNWRLLMAPQPVIDYVIVHELAHLKEMNHSKRFWDLVAAHCPGWRRHRKWLKDHQAELASRVVPPKT